MVGLKIRTPSIALTTSLQFPIFRSHPDGKEILWLIAEHFHILCRMGPPCEIGAGKNTWPFPGTSQRCCGDLCPVLLVWEPQFSSGSHPLSPSGHVDCWMAKRVTGKEQLYHPAIPAMLKLLSSKDWAWTCWATWPSHGRAYHPRLAITQHRECRHSPDGIFRAPGYSQAWS